MGSILNNKNLSDCDLLKYNIFNSIWKLFN